MLSGWDVANSAVRTFLTSLYLRPFRYERMYFYTWGQGPLTIVLHGVDGPPAEAARFLDQRLKKRCRYGQQLQPGHRSSGAGVPHQPRLHSRHAPAVTAQREFEHASCC